MALTLTLVRLMTTVIVSWGTGVLLLSETIYKYRTGWMHPANSWIGLNARHAQKKQHKDQTWPKQHKTNAWANSFHVSSYSGFKLPRFSSFGQHISLPGVCTQQHKGRNAQSSPNDDTLQCDTARRWNNEMNILNCSICKQVGHWL